MTAGMALAMAMDAQPDLPWTDQQQNHKRMYEWCADMRAALKLRRRTLTVPERRIAAQ
jgi:hypothetical protein